MSYAVIDVEATGFSTIDRVIEVAVVILDDELVEVSAHESLIDPGGDGPIGATHIHGISRAMLRGAPSFSQLANGIAARLDGHTLVAHNWTYDRRMLTQEAQRAGRVLRLDGPSLDTMELAKRAGLPAALGKLAPALGVSTAGAHRALADVRITAEVLRRLLARAAA